MWQQARGDVVELDASRESEDSNERLRLMREAFGASSSEVPESPVADRDREIVRLREQGLGLAAIGNRVGLTRERVRQILVQVGGPSAADVRRIREAARREQSGSIEELIRTLLRDRGASTAEAVATWLSVTPAQVKLHWPPDMKSFLLRPSSRLTRWADEQVLAAIRQAGTYEFPLRRRTYDELVEIGEVDGPKSVRVMQRFGTWKGACDLAGVESVEARRDTYQSRWTDEDLLAFARTYLRSVEGAGSFRDYDIWRGNQAGAPSGQTLRNRLGSWTSIKRQALGGEL